MAASRDALHAVARDLEGIDDHDPGRCRLVNLDLTDVVTVNFIGRAGFSARTGVGPDLNAEGFLINWLRLSSAPAVIKLFVDE